MTNTMRALGAELTVVPSDGSITRELIETVIATAAEYASEPDTYYTNQFSNPSWGSGHTVATIACDRGLKYLTGRLYA